MDIKIEANLLDNKEMYKDNDNLVQYTSDEQNINSENHRPGIIKNEAISEYGSVELPQQDLVSIKNEAIQIEGTRPESLTGINNKLLYNNESIGLQSVTDPISNKEKKYYKCSICEHSFSYKRQLICHLRTHTGEKPYNCPWCDYKSTQKVNLTCHIRRNHTGEKPYNCTFCDFKSTTKYQLICHVRIHTGEKPFSCFFCDYRCAHKVDMTRHMRIHTGEKPFACTFCDHKSADKRDLTHHIRIHTGEKPYKCNFCDYKCIKKSYLNAHVKVHTGEKPFCCTLCDYKCTRNAVLTRHLKSHATGKQRVKKKIVECKEEKIMESESNDCQLEKIKYEECIIKEEKIKIEIQYS